MHRLIGWLLIAVSATWAQQYPFLPVAGSPQDVQGLFQDSRGRLWLTGPDLACFDGARFFFLRDYGFPALTQSLGIAEDPSGNIWIAAQTGVYRFSGGWVEQVSGGVVATGIVAVTSEMAIATEGPAGTASPQDVALVRIQRIGGKWISEAVMDLDSPGPITLDPFGMLLYPQSINHWSEIRLQDVVRWRSGEQVETIRHGAPGGLPVSGRIVRDRAGCVWSNSPEGSAYDCGEGKRRARFDGASLPSNNRETPDGRIVLVGQTELAIGRPGTFQIASHANGLPGLLDAVAGRDGTLWLNTTDGLYRFPSPFRIEYWTIREGLSDPPWSLARAGERVYAGLVGKIATLSPDRFRWNVIAKFEEKDRISGLLALDDGSLFASFWNAGGAQLSTDGRVLARTMKGRPVASGKRLARTPDGEVWMSGVQLGRIRRAGSILKFENHPLQRQPSANVFAIKYEEHTHRLWACYDGGLVVRDERGGWREFTTRDGLQVNDCWSVAPLPNGDAWYAYKGFPGFALIRPEAGGNIVVRQYGRKDVVEAGSVTLDTDRSGRLWRGGLLGIYVADEVEAEAAQWLRLDKSDGFPANDMNAGSFFVDKDGSFWWGTDNDLAHYSPPPDLVSPGFAPEIFVSAFSWEGQAPRLAEAVRSVPHGAGIVAHVGSLQFDRRSALKLRYRLLPEQTKWQETKNLDLALGALGSGEHSLELQGRVFTGPWSRTVRRSFTVLRPVWLAGPAMGSYFLLGAMLAVSGYWLYRRRKAEGAQLLPDLGELRLQALVPEAQQLSGTLLDERFRVGRQLAEGGFANVMDGYDQSRKERCAIKIFRTEVKDKPWVERSFDTEVAALEKVRHPNVVSIRAYGRTDSGTPYLVMDFVEGTSLREILSKGALERRRVARLLRHLASALDAIHALGICHRDLKPENVIVCNAGSSEEEPGPGRLFDCHH